MYHMGMASKPTKGQAMLKLEAAKLRGEGVWQRIQMVEYDPKRRTLEISEWAKGRRGVYEIDFHFSVDARGYQGFSHDMAFAMLDACNNVEVS